MSESSEKTQSLRETNERIASLRSAFQEKYGRIPQEIEFTEGEEALAGFYCMLLGSSCRPTMYVANGSFDGLANFVHGVEWGLKFGREPLPCLKVVTNRGFDVQLSDYYRTPRNIPWSSALMKIFQNEAEAIAQMSLLYAEYLHELRSGLWDRDNGPVKKKRRVVKAISPVRN